MAGIIQRGGIQQAAVKIELVLLKNRRQAEVTVLQKLFRLQVVLFQHILRGLMHLVGLRFVKGIGFNCNIPGVAPVQGGLRADKQADGGGQHDQNHGRQNADGSKARAVALHAVHHG